MCSRLASDIEKVQKVAPTLTTEGGAGERDGRLWAGSALLTAATQLRR